MTQPYLPLELFVEIGKVWQSDKFQDRNAFSYLGKRLDTWIHKVLDDLGVGSEPKILGSVHPASFISGRVYIAEAAHVEPTAMIQGPCIIGPGAEVRHGAYIRGCVFIGAKAVVGHTTEVKGSVFFDDAKAGHFAYIGDSILGRDVNLGAGTKLANLKIKGDEVKYRDPTSNERVGSGLRKFSSILGDHVQTGCNSVLSPGSLLLPKTAVLPCVHFHGTLKSGIATQK